MSDSTEKEIEATSVELHDVEHISTNEEVAPATVVTTTPEVATTEEKTTGTGVSGTLADLDPDMQEKVRAAFTEHGVDYDSALNGAGAGNVDPAKVVKDFDKLDPETQEKIRKAFLDPKVKASIANSDIESQLALEKEMDKIKKEIDWDKIEKDATGIPVLTNDDIIRIVGIGASSKDDLKILIQSARASIDTARREIPIVKKAIAENETNSADPTLSEEAKKRFDDEKEKLDKEIKANEDLEKSSIETLAVFQDLARKTVQELIDDNAFVKALSVISTKIALTTFDAGNTGYSNAFYKNINEQINSSIDSKEFIDFIHSAFNPFVKINYNFSDSFVDVIYALNNFEIEKSQPDESIDGAIIKKLMSFTKSVDTVAKYPLSIASRYVNRVDTLFYKDHPSYDNAKRESLGWPKASEVDASLIADLNTSIDNIETYINDHFADIRTNLSSLYQVALINLNILQSSKKNTFIKKVKLYSSFLFVESFMSQFDAILSGKIVSLKKTGEDGKEEYDTKELTEEEIKRYIYLTFTYIILLAVYMKSQVKINYKLAHHTDLEKHSKSANDVLRYINSKLLLNLDLLDRFDVTKVTPPKAADEAVLDVTPVTEDTAGVSAVKTTPVVEDPVGDTTPTPPETSEPVVEEKKEKEYSIATFFDESVYKNLSEEVLIAFKDLDITAARSEAINNSITIAKTIVDLTRSVIKTIAEGDVDSTIFSTPSK